MTRGDPDGPHAGRQEEQWVFGVGASRGRRGRPVLRAVLDGAAGTLSPAVPPSVPGSQCEAATTSSRQPGFSLLPRLPRPAAHCDCPTKPAPCCAACPQVFRGTTKHAPDECRFLLTVAGNGHLRSFWKPVFTAGHGQRGGRRDQGGPGLGLGLHTQHMATRCQRAPQGQTQKLSVTLKPCPKYRHPVTTC